MFFNIATNIKQRIDNIADNTNVNNQTFPETCKIELTGKCTLNCNFCFNSEFKKTNTRQKLLSDEEFNIIYENIINLNSLREVGLFYMGESGIHPKIDKYYEKIHNRFFTFLTTNGTVIDNILRAIKYIDSLKVSWNYTDENDFMQKTNQSSQLYFRIIDNIKILYNKCHNFNKKLSVSTVLDKDKKLYEKSLSMLMYDEHYWIPLQTQNGYNNEGLDGVVGEDDKKYNQIPCWSLFKGLYIDVDLNVRACCYGHDLCFILGNLRNNSLIYILNSEKYKIMKEKHLNGIIPNECKKCLRSISISNYTLN